MGNDSNNNTRTQQEVKKWMLIFPRSVNKEWFW